MRISDWSSDVCSSDLGKRQAGQSFSGQRLADAISKIDSIRCKKTVIMIDVIQTGVDLSQYGFEQTLDLGITFLAGSGKLGVISLGTRNRADTLPLGQIGRASCRERVWQYG